ncbi:hypothetical protein DACRYDRAFT_106989 [Dacryopinax primogenitus]|uniref:CBM21 domain-containing protein n=1 Tax=Dacryopinax primogenitus (strain DJM 731) TaxID=1858805 RepID=M5FXX9_DACPD|nr:uncharacterized protein DACRYDRAFT_106989 [Dacryopinax primogenitus]EJU02906.1 hypothetical protein DACRYDRAFT_106989 [Dacryopinax primogenitus]
MQERFSSRAATHLAVLSSTAISNHARLISQPDDDALKVPLSPLLLPNLPVHNTQNNSNGGNCFKLKHQLRSSIKLPKASGMPLPANKLIQVPKSVHFPTEKSRLEHVVFFFREQTPITMKDEEKDISEKKTSPLESFSRFQSSQCVNSTPAPLLVQLNRLQTSAIPNASFLRIQDETQRQPVMLESFYLSESSPLVICGTVIVRNIAFHKNVTIRCTVNDWQTFMDVSSHHMSHLDSLPYPTPHRPPSVSPDTRRWDRFRFKIRIEDVKWSFEEVTMYLAVRFACSGQEWWDNNGGSNYRVAFLTAPCIETGTRASTDTYSSSIFSTMTDFKPAPPFSTVFKPLQKTFSPPCSDRNGCRCWAVRRPPTFVLVANASDIMSDRERRQGSGAELQERKSPANSGRKSPLDALSVTTNKKELSSKPAFTAVGAKQLHVDLGSLKQGLTLSYTIPLRLPTVPNIGPPCDRNERRYREFLERYCFFNGQD